MKDAGGFSVLCICWFQWKEKSNHDIGTATFWSIFLHLHSPAGTWRETWKGNTLCNSIFNQPCWYWIYREGDWCSGYDRGHSAGCIIVLWLCLVELNYTKPFQIFRFDFRNSLHFLFKICQLKNFFKNVIRFILCQENMCRGNLGILVRIVLNIIRFWSITA